MITMSNLPKALLQWMKPTVAVIEGAQLTSISIVPTDDGLWEYGIALSGVKVHPERQWRWPWVRRIVVRLRAEPAGGE